MAEEAVRTQDPTDYRRMCRRLGDARLGLASARRAGVGVRRAQEELSAALRAFGSLERRDALDDADDADLEAWLGDR